MGFHAACLSARRIFSWARLRAARPQDKAQASASGQLRAGPSAAAAVAKGATCGALVHVTTHKLHLTGLSLASALFVRCKSRTGQHVYAGSCAHTLKLAHAHVYSVQQRWTFCRSPFERRSPVADSHFAQQISARYLVSKLLHDFCLANACAPLSKGSVQATAMESPHQNQATRHASQLWTSGPARATWRCRSHG